MLFDMSEFAEFRGTDLLRDCGTNGHEQKCDMGDALPTRDQTFM